MQNTKEKLIIIDSFALIFRAYYAFPPTLTLPDGTPINAAFGFASLLLDVLKKLKPSHVIAVFDSKGPVIRQSDFVLYKVNRKEADDEFIVQIPYVRNILDAFDIPVLNVEGYEADDIIGTIDEKHSGTWAETIIVTGDQDLFQLVDSDTSVFLAARKFSDSSLFNADSVFEKLGVRPDQVIDFKAIAGDSSDNIPGVSGIGKKGAVDLLKEFDSLENIYEKIESVANRYKNKLAENYEMAFKSKQLATIHKDVPISFDFKNAEFSFTDPKKVIKLFKDYNFKSLLTKLELLVPSALKQLETTENNEEAIEEFDEEKIDLKKLDSIYIYPVIANLDKSLVCWSVDYLYVQTSDSMNLKVTKDKVTQFFKLAVLANLDIYTIYLKELLHALANNKITIDFESLITKKKLHELIIYGFITGEGRVKNDLAKQLDFYGIELNALTPKAIVQKLSEFKNNIFAKLGDQTELKEVIRLEHEIIPVIINMERNGISLNTESLKEIEGFLTETKINIQQEIFKEVGHEFNISSPKQVSEILFKERDLPLGKQSKSGNFSTNERILSKLVNVDPVVSKILLYREIEKLLSTYIKPLPGFVDNDGRVHAIFDQLGAVSGRFSSKNPNMQNIPTSNSFDISIRSAFEVTEGSIFIGFDFAQQELRILAALAKEQKLIESFNKGEDVHKLTASEMFNKKIEDVTKEERAVGKTINFSIIYGISAFGLSDRMNIDQAMAKDFIKTFFIKYPNIAKYFEDMKTEILKTNKAKTFLGRIRSNAGSIPTNRFAKEAIERELTNFRIQGTAADIMKIALLKINPILKKFDAKLILQIHDEYLFEYKLARDSKIEDKEEAFIDLYKKNKELQEFVKEIREAMLNTIDLGVKYEVAVSIGLNWGNTYDLD